MNKWWNQTVFYQIYMPSFCDGNEDGIGDFRGITEKLHYLKELGIGGIWLTPFYSSPKVDNGYDISDYYQIDSDYGTMEDFDNFLIKAHSLGIRVIGDMVINHTSSKHAWFLESCSSPDSEKRDWYIWKQPVLGGKPNNWESFFGESAWELDGKTGEYYYHSFAKEQVDLNFANKEVKKAIFDVLDFWVSKGLDGFRFDVINNLTLTDNWSDNPVDTEGRQIHLYDVNQPGIHDFLKEMRRYLECGKDLFLVGEISSDNLELIHSYAQEGELHTAFNFNLGSIQTFSFKDFYNEVSNMNRIYQKDEKPTLFFGSHDLGRFASRFKFDAESIKGLITFMMCYDGIPFLYSGDEIGMQSYVCQTAADARDIQGLIVYEKAKNEGKTEKEALQALNEETRDKSRNVMQWSGEKYGGFSTVKPWIPYLNRDSECNVESQRRDRDSILNYVAKLILIRNTRSELTQGVCAVEKIRENIMICTRVENASKLTAVINFSNQAEEIGIDGNAELIIGTKGVKVITKTTAKATLSLPPKGSCIYAV